MGSPKTDTTTHMTWTSDAATGDLIFSGRVAQRDLLSLNFDRIDRQVIGCPITVASDLCQTLEIIFLRMEQQNRKNLPPLSDEAGEAMKRICDEI